MASLKSRGRDLGRRKRIRREDQRREKEL